MEQTNEQNAEQQCVDELALLTSKKHVLITRRGNASIRMALKLAKSLGYDEVLLQDQGGWITYKQFCDREKLKWHELKTDQGIISPELLRRHHHFILLMNSLPAYSFYQDMKSLSEVCAKNNIFLINDVSGSIGTDAAKYGDIALGSFGLDKPINLGDGGFIAVDKKFSFDFLKEHNLDISVSLEGLLKRIKGLEARLAHLSEVRNKLIQKLEATEFASNIIKKEDKGINLIVSFDSEKEKEKLIKLSSRFGVEHTLCPREIRVLKRAVCFEIKRLQ